jgi:Tfp pilus assembly protein PilO
VTLTDRDRKVLIFVVPVVVIMAYWFLLLSPQRQEASKAAEAVITQEERRDMAQVQLDAAKNAEQDFSADYTQIVRLGKAIPASVDMPSLIVQLDAAATGTGISFTKIKTGERVDSAATAPTTAPGTTPPGTTPPADPATPAAAGGEQAQSAPGGAAEAANNTAATANQQAAAADTQTSTSSDSGLAVGGGSAAPGPAGTPPVAPAGLETVPLELEFTGNFFNLADFFHRVKRFVEVANSDVVVSGRLLTVQGVRWSSDPEIFPKIRAEMKATIYLSPKAQGPTAGATPAGPSTTPATTTTPAGATPAPEPAVTPTAAATP